MNKNFIKRLLKPDRRKTLIFLSFLLLSLNQFLKILPLPLEYYVLSGYISHGLDIMLLPAHVLWFIPAYILGGSGIIGITIFILAVLVGLYIDYIFICLFVSIWDKLFGFFGRNRRYYEIGVVVLLVLFFAVSLIIIPSKSYDAVSSETYVPSQLPASEVFDCNTDLQVTTVKNGSGSTVIYEMLDVTLCLYDVQSGVAEDFAAFYGTDTDYSIEEEHRNIVTLEPHAEERVYLRGTFGSFPMDELIAEYTAKYDELLFFRNIGYNNDEYCGRLTAEDIRNAERIKIIK